MRDWLVLIVALCGVVEAAEPPALPTLVAVPRWEYAMLAVVHTGQDVSLALETSTRKALPRNFDGQPTPQNLAALEFVAGGDGEFTFRNTAAALSWAGKEGWEIVQHLGRGQYLARRPVPPK